MFDIDRWVEIWVTITRNKTRSLLTGFGVFWGILMLVILLGSGTGFKNGVWKNVNGFATNSAFFFSERTGEPYKGYKKGRYWQMRNEAREPGVDVMAWLNASRKDLEKLEEEFAVHSTTRTAAEVGDRVLAEIYDEQERRRAGEQLQITTGIDEFDHYLGGLYRGELLVLAGRPSMGKTALALHMALAAARQGKKVCFFSLEMTERQLISRLLCTLSGVEPDKLRFKLMDADDQQRLDKAAAELRKLPLFLNYCSGCGLAEIRARCMVLNRKHKLDLMIVDYLNLVNVSADRGEVKDTMDLALGEVAGGLKTLSMEQNVACLVLAQLNRNCETRTDHIPMMSDLRNSGEIEQIADSIAMVYRPEQYGELSDPVTRESFYHVGRFFVIKNRNGGTGEVRFRYNDSLTQIYPYKK